MKLEFRRPHMVPPTELRARIEARVADYAARYPQHDIAAMHRWTSETTAVATYRGAEARLAFDAATITVELELPFFARPFRARIESFLADEHRHLADGALSAR